MSLTAQVYAEPLNGQSSHPGRRCRREQHDATFGVTANMTPSANGNAGPDGDLQTDSTQQPCGHRLASKATLYQEGQSARCLYLWLLSLHRPTPGAGTAQIGSLAAFTSPTSLRTTSDRVASVMGSTTEDPATQPSSPVA